MGWNWNPLDTVKDVGNFAYQNSGLDNFANIAKSAYKGNLNVGFNNFGDENSLWGNLGAGAVDAGFTFLPGARLGSLALKQGLKSAGYRAAGSAIKSGVKATATGFNPKSAFKYIVGNLNKSGAKTLAQNAAFALPANYLLSKTVGPYYQQALTAAANVIMPNAQAATPYSATSTNRSASPAGTYKETGKSPSMGDTVFNEPQPGANGVPGSYLDPTTNSYYNSGSSNANSQYTTGANRIQSSLLDAIASLNRIDSGTIQQEASAQAGPGGWGASAPQMDVFRDYSHNITAGDIAAQRLKSADDLAQLDMNRANTLNSISLQKQAAENDARYKLFMEALQKNKLNFSPTQTGGN